MHGDGQWARRSLAAFWLFAGSMHFVRPRFYEAIVPPPLHRRRREVVAVSGVAELVGGVAVASGRVPGFARWWLLATLAGVVPANVFMAVRSERFTDLPAWALWLRLPFQLLFGWHVWRGTAD